MRMFSQIILSILLLSTLSCGQKKAVSAAKPWQNSFNNGIHLKFTDLSNNPQNLAITYNIIQARLINLKSADQCDFFTVEKNSLIVQLPKIKFSQTSVKKITSPALLECRIILRNDIYPPVVSSIVTMTGKDIEDIMIIPQKNLYTVKAMIKSKTLVRLKALEKKLTNKMLAFCLNNEIIAALVLSNAINNQAIELGSNLSLSEAKALAILRCGLNLPSTVKLVESKPLTKILWRGRK